MPDTLHRIILIIVITTQILTNAVPIYANKGTETKES